MASDVQATKAVKPLQTRQEYVNTLGRHTIGRFECAVLCATHLGLTITSTAITCAKVFIGVIGSGIKRCLPNEYGKYLNRFTLSAAAEDLMFTLFLAAKTANFALQVIMGKPLGEKEFTNELIDGVKMTLGLDITKIEYGREKQVPTRSINSENEDTRFNLLLSSRADSLFQQALLKFSSTLRINGTLEISNESNKIDAMESNRINNMDFYNVNIENRSKNINERMEILGLIERYNKTNRVVESKISFVQETLNYSINKKEETIAFAAPNAYKYLAQLDTYLIEEIREDLILLKGNTSDEALRTFLTDKGIDVYLSKIKAFRIIENENPNLINFSENQKKLLKKIENYIPQAQAWAKTPSEFARIIDKAIEEESI